MEACVESRSLLHLLQTPALEVQLQASTDGGDGKRLQRHTHGGQKVRSELCTQDHRLMEQQLRLKDVRCYAFNGKCVTNREMRVAFLSRE